MKQFLVGGVLLGMLVLTSGAFGQEGTGRGDFTIKDIHQVQVPAPSYGDGGLGGHPSTLYRMWLKIEVEFASRPEWADDVQVKYYVLLEDKTKGKPEDYLLEGELTHINVAKGGIHFSAMFIHPNTLKRYGGGVGEMVTARIFYKGVLVSSKTISATGPKPETSWWDKYSPLSGCLLAPQDTPWAPIANEHFEAVKSTHP